MTEIARAFVAIELPDEAKSALSGLVDQLREAKVRGMRTVRPEGIHLTLKFLGNIPATRVEPIVVEVSKAAAKRSPFKLELGEAGVFPNRARTRVLWVGIDGNLPLLLELHGGVEDALAGLGFEMERRPYSPHLTVARLGDRASTSDRKEAAQALHAARFQAGLRIAVTAIVLMQSTLGQEGARYRRLAHMPLAGILQDDTS